MHKVKAFGLLSVLALCAGLRAGETQPPAAEAPSAIAILPGAAEVVLHVPSVNALKKALSESDFGKLWAEEDLQRFAKPAVQACLEQYAELRKSMPALPELCDLEQVFQGEVALSLVLPGGPADAPLPTVCAVFQIADAKAAARLLAPVLNKQPLEEGKVVALPAPNPGASPALVYTRGRLLVSSQAGQLEKMRARLASPQPADDSLAAAKDWTDAQRLLGPPGRMSVWVALPSILKAALAQQEAEEAQKITKVLERTGLSGVRALALQTATRGPALTLDQAVVWDGPPASLLAKALDPQPIPVAALKIVPENAAYCSASRADLAGIFELVRALLDPDDQKRLAEGLVQAKAQLGVDLEKDFLALLGDTWISCAVGGSECFGLLPGMALSVSLKDGPKFQKSLELLIDAAEKGLAGAGGHFGPKIEFRRTTLDGTPIRYLNFSPLPFSPCMAVIHERLLFTSSVAGMRRALRQLSAPRDITANAAFQEALQRVGGTFKDPQLLPGMFSFSNPRSGGALLSSLVPFGQLLQGGLKLQARRLAVWGGGQMDPGAKLLLDLLDKLDFALFPSDEVCARHLRPTASLMLKAAGGTVMRSELTLPSAHAFSQGGFLAVGVLAGLTVPVVERSSESARRMACASNLAQIGKACAMFCDVAANEGKNPKRLEQLFDAYIKDERVFLCPGIKDGKHGPGQGKIKHCDYIFIPGTRPTEATDVLAFSPKAAWGGKGRNVLVVGGSVEWIGDDEAFKKSVLETLKNNNLSIELPKSTPAKALTPELEKSLLQAVKDLASEDFGTRDAAMKVLSEAGESARKPLETGLQSKDLETQNRCKETLARLDAGKNMSKDERAWIEMLRRELNLNESKVRP